MDIDLSKTQKYLDWLKRKLYLDKLSEKSKTRVVKRWQVYWCDFGIGIGSEMSKESPRPCVILQKTVINKNSPNTFIIFGLHKKVKKYIEKNAKFIPNIKTKYPKIKALVQSPTVGGIIDVGTTKEKIDYWFEKGVYVMSLEEATEYSKYLNASFFTIDPTIKMILNSLNY